MGPLKTTSAYNGQEKAVDFKAVEPLLQRSFGDEDLKVVDFEATRLLPPGENYCSIIVKLDVKVSRDGKEEMLHLVAKTPSPSEKAVIEWPLVFKKELFMYAELRAVYRELDKNSGIEENEVINVWPEYIGYRNSLNEDDEIDVDSLLLMRNIKYDGFYTLDRRQGMDVHHARKALRSLARYHALGIAMKQKRPAFAKKAIDQARILGVDFAQVNDGYDKILKTIFLTPSLQKHLSMIEWSFEQIKDGKPYKEMPSEPWATITHGDFWVNNILFHKDELDNVDDVKFVDFQMYLYASPLKDLPYFFTGSLNKTAQAKYLNELIDLYYVTFVKTLKRTGCDTLPFTRESFDRELKKQAISQLPLCALAAKFFIFEIDNDNQSNEELIKNIFNDRASDVFLNKLSGLLELYDKMGWFS